MSDELVHIDVWSDYVCPFCYLELPVLGAVCASLGDGVVVTWRAFELRPTPVPTLDPYGDYLRTTWARAVYPMAHERGMTLRLPPVQPRSRRALEAAEFARARGRFEAMHLALFRAFFEQGRDIGAVDVLADVAGSVGLPGEALREALAARTHTRRVLDDERLADRLGLAAVPTMLVRRADVPLEESVWVSGAQPEALLREAVERARRRERRVDARGRPRGRALPLATEE